MQSNKRPTRTESIKGMLEDLRQQALKKAEHARNASDKTMQVSYEVMAGFLGDALAAHGIGHYGKCENCSREIPLLRLAQFPLDPRCEPCAKANEVSRSRELILARLREQMNKKTHAGLFMPA